MRVIALNQAPTAWSMSPAATLLASANTTWSLKLVATDEGSFQDFPGLGGPARAVRFTPSGDAVVVAAGSLVYVWNVLV